MIYKKNRSTISKLNQKFLPLRISGSISTNGSIWPEPKAKIELIKVVQIGKRLE